MDTQNNSTENITTLAMIKNILHESQALLITCFFIFLALGCLATGIYYYIGGFAAPIAKVDHVLAATSIQKRLQQMEIVKIKHQYALSPLVAFVVTFKDGTTIDYLKEDYHPEHLFNKNNKYILLNVTQLQYFGSEPLSYQSPSSFIKDLEQDISFIESEYQKMTHNPNDTWK